jgi:basic membrane protein A and related proteins
MRKIQWLSALLLMLALAACGGSSEPAATATDTAPATDCSSPDLLCIGVVTDVGQIDDKSFNQSAWEGAQTAVTAFGAKVEYVETRDATDYANNLNLFIADKYDVIITVGFALGEATAEAAKANPGIHFIGVDQFQGEALPNVAGLIFNEDKAGYLGGALAAMMAAEQGSDTIAAVLGTDLIPPVVAFKDGFEAGARAINPDIKVISTFHPGGLDVAFTDPEWGAATAKQAIDQGATVVFGAGGQTGNGALIEVAGNAGLYCIGVDTDQWETVPEARPCLISSAMKLITVGVADLIAAHVAGNFPAGNFIGEVGLAPFHDFASVVPAEVQTRLQQIDAGLRDGSISTGYGQ